MTELDATTNSLHPSWNPLTWAGAVSGAVVVLGFTVAHDLFISDIWFNVGPMILSGAVCGLCVTWSYRESVAKHSTDGWFRYAALLAGEMIALGAVSLAVLRPRFTMDELMVADDAIDQLIPPSMPLMAVTMVMGTLLFWLYSGRRNTALPSIGATQVLLVFLLGHQFAFLGLVEPSSTLMWLFAEFALITFGLAAAFGVGVMWLGLIRERSRR